MGLWISEDEKGINGVAYRYLDTLHLYSKNQFPLREVLELIEELQPKCIYGPLASVEPLCNQLKEDYVCELNHIITIDHLTQGNSNLEVQLAEEKDIPEIVTLMMKDPIYYSVYTHEILEYQWRERIRAGFSRLFLLRNEFEKVIATNATTAETDTMVVIGGIMTDPDLRRQGLGRVITASAWNLVLNEEKRGLSFLLVDNQNTIILHRKMGFDFLGLYARLLRTT